MDELEHRDQWVSRKGFVFATIGAAVGLGNLWRFPFMAYENGGGAFLIPYLFALLTAGVPLLIMEFGLGQKMRRSATGALVAISPKLEWLGWWMVMIPLAVIVYYSVIVSWGLIYLVLSVNLAWGSDPVAFFGGELLAVSSGPWDFGGVQWIVLLATLAVWLSTFFITRKGISKGIERVSKFATPLLGILFVFIVIRSVTLPGAPLGLNQFLHPDFSQIMNPQVWVAAYGQVFFSTTIAVGVMIAYASYLPKRSDIVNNSFITVFSNGTFDLLAGLAVFSVLGYIAATTSVPFDEVAQSGAGIAFAAFPQAINLFPGGPVVQSLFGVVFFFCLVIAGITSVISMMESFVSAYLDKFHGKRETVVAWVTVIGFAVSILFTTQAGVHLLDIVDHFVNSYGIALIGLVEAIVLGYFYNIKAMRDHVNRYSDFRVGVWWEWCIKYVTPLVLGYMFITNVWTELSSPYGGYPASAVTVFGWLVAVAMLAVALYLGFATKGKFGSGSADHLERRNDRAR